MNRTMTWGDMFLILVFGLVLSNTVWAGWAGEYTVKRGDTLSKIGVVHKLPWQTIWNANKGKIANPNNIRPGQKLRIPDGEKTPTVAPAIIKGGVRVTYSPKQLNVVKTADCPRGRDANGYCPYVGVNQDSVESSLRSELKRIPNQAKKVAFLKQAVRQLFVSVGLTEVEISEVYDYAYLQYKERLLGLSQAEDQQLSQIARALRTQGIVETRWFKIGQRFSHMTYDKFKVRENVVAAWKGYKADPWAAKPEEVRASVFHFSTGRAVSWIIHCLNVNIPDVPKKPPPPKEPPTQVPPPEFPELPPLPPEEVERQVLCDMVQWSDLWLSAGGVHGNGSDTYFGFLSGKPCLYLQEVEGGRFVYGPRGHYGRHSGVTTRDGFKFNGYRWGVGPDVGYFDDDGWDVRFGPFFGGLHEEGSTKDGRFRQSRDFDLIGLDTGFNLYQRQAKGERLFPKTQFFLQAGFPIGDGDVRRTFDGQDLGPGDFGDFDLVASVGIRQFIYDKPFDLPIRTFASLEWFGELPGVSALNLGIGATDIRECVYVWGGPSWDLIGGGVAGLWTIGVDALGCTRAVTHMYRQDAWLASLEDQGIGYDEETGAFTLPEDVDSKTKTLNSSERKKGL